MCVCDMNVIIHYLEFGGNYYLFVSLTTCYDFLGCASMPF